MRHLTDHRKLGRTRSHRTALLRNMVVSLIQHGRIETTLPKAKELRRVADRMVTWGKKGTLSARRRARSVLNDRGALAKLFTELAPRFAKRNGGYTRILKTQFRTGDQAPMAFIEYVDNPVAVPAPAKKTAAKKTSEKEKKAKK